MKTGLTKKQKVTEVYYNAKESKVQKMIQFSDSLVA